MYDFVKYLWTNASSHKQELQKKTEKPTLNMETPGKCSKIKHGPHPSLVPWKHWTVKQQNVPRRKKKNTSMK